MPLIKLQNRILCIIRAWSLFWSIQICTSLHFLPVLLKSQCYVFLCFLYCCLFCVFCLCSYFLSLMSSSKTFLEHLFNYCFTYNNRSVILFAHSISNARNFSGIFRSIYFCKAVSQWSKHLYWLADTISIKMVCLSFDQSHDINKDHLIILCQHIISP